MPERADEPALAVHRKVSRGPNRRRADIAGEHCILSRQIAQCPGNLLRMDEFPAGFSDRQIVKTLSRLEIMFHGLIEVSAVLFLLQQRKQGVNRRTHTADEPQMDRRAAAELLWPYVDLSDAGLSLRVKLAIWEIRTKHEQRITIIHCVIPGRESNQPCDADNVGVVPLNVLLAFEGVDHRALKFFAQREELIMRAGASGTTQKCDAACAIQEVGERLKACRLRSYCRLVRQQVERRRRWNVRRRLERHISRDHDYGNTALSYRLANRDFKDPRHLARSGDEFAIMAALFEKRRRMCFLEIPRADLGRGDLGRNRQNRNARAMTVKQTIDQVEIARPAASGANRE